MADVDGERDTTFRELDRLHAAVKGTAFRAFKRVHGQLREGRDFHTLTAATDAARIEALRREQRIYPSSVNVVLLTESGRQAVSLSMGAVSECSNKQEDA
jgi:hypothetical protein